MCGITGIAFSTRDPRSVDPAVLARMRDALTHRGPDDHGLYTDGKIGLAHRRLSIVDVSHGHQPMLNEDESVVIVYNGEVYNHADYRGELLGKGYKYRTHCDTETLLYLYEEYGARSVEKMRGMFAFAVWDQKNKTLFLARDRLGVKPLYYVHDDRGNLFFASEIKSILQSGYVPARLNYRALPDQLANHGTSGDETLFEGIKRLAPGHALTWKDGRISIEKYWDVSYEPKHEGRTDRSYVEEWRELFQESVRIRLMADVPLGMFLSGGIDSSAICAVMAKMVDEPIQTFSVGFKEREANEFQYARLVAQAFGTNHHEITLTPEEFFAALPQLVWHEDEPLGFIASVPLYFVSKLAQQHVKVVLTGEGSDEMLGGYGRYRKTLLNLAYAERYQSLAPAALRRMIAKITQLVPGTVGRKLGRTFLTRPNTIEDLYLDNFAVFSRSPQEQLLSGQSLERIGDRNPYTVLRQHLASTDARDLLDKLLHADTKTYLHELLMKQDQMSMAASIESRVPFLDYQLVEYTARLPRHLKLRNGETKWILREAMRDLLPPQILTRSKMGFPVPVGSWLRNEFRHVVDEFVLGGRALQRGIFNPEYVRMLAARHFAGENHDERLWFLINFEMWQRAFLD
jgi:asparagine synthase (glutamine-hydrolysing)